ncbi:MAG: AAA family ATPase, partial [Bryobacteraceae bacterium]
MFSAILIMPDKDAAAAVEQLAVESKQVAISKRVEHLPASYELARTMNTFAPDLVFLDLTDWENALPLADTIRSHASAPAIIGYGSDWIRQFAGQFAEAGVAAVLTSPLRLEAFQESVQRAIHKVRAAVQDNLVALLPGKAGSGASTLTFNVAGNLARILDKKVLVIEGDIHSGVLSILLDVTPSCPVLELLENSSSLDFSRLSSSVVRAFGVEFLLTNRIKKRPLPLWSDYHQLLQFAMPKYDLILVDLPEVVNDGTTEIVRRARSVVVVCTPELASIALAEQRITELKSRGVPTGRIGIVLNRFHKSGMKPAEIESILNQSIVAVVPNDYKAVNRATIGRQLVDLE